MVHMLAYTVSLCLSNSVYVCCFCSGWFLKCAYQGFTHLNREGSTSLAIQYAVKVAHCHHCISFAAKYTVRP